MTIIQRVLHKMFGHYPVAEWAHHDRFYKITCKWCGMRKTKDGWR